MKAYVRKTNKHTLRSRMIERAVELPFIQESLLDALMAQPVSASRLMALSRRLASIAQAVSYMATKQITRDLEDSE